MRPVARLLTGPAQFRFMERQARLLPYQASPHVVDRGSCQDGNTGGSMRHTRRLSGTLVVVLSLFGAAPFAARGEDTAGLTLGSDPALEVISTLAPPPAGVRDPFIPLVEPAVREARRPTLSGLRLTGLIWDGNAAEQTRALVETAEGLGYILRLNDQRFGGQVVAIGPDRLRFSVVDQSAGQRRIQLIELRLDQAEPTIIPSSDGP